MVPVSRWLWPSLSGGGNGEWVGSLTRVSEVLNEAHLISCCTEAGTEGFHGTAGGWRLVLLSLFLFVLPASLDLDRPFHRLLG